MVSHVSNEVSEAMQNLSSPGWLRAGETAKSLEVGSLPEKHASSEDLQDLPPPPPPAPQSLAKDVNLTTQSCDQTLAALPTLLPAPPMVARPPLSSLPATACGLTRPQGFPKFEATTC